MDFQERPPLGRFGNFGAAAMAIGGRGGVGGAQIDGGERLSGHDGTVQGRRGGEWVVRRGDGRQCGGGRVVLEELALFDKESAMRICLRTWHRTQFRFKMKCQF